MTERQIENRVKKLREIESQRKALEEQEKALKEELKRDMESKGLEEIRTKNFIEYYPPWEPPVSRFRATRKWYFPPSEPPQHIVAAHIFDFTINLLIVILGELLMQYHQIIYREVFLCLRRQKSEVFWNFWEKI